MSEKSKKIIYLISTILFTLMILVSVYNQLFNREMIEEEFQDLGYPSYIINVLAILKLLGLIAIWTKKSIILKEWAYAGFTFNIFLAFYSQVYISSDDVFFPLIALVLLCLSYCFDKTGLCRVLKCSAGKEKDM